MFPRQFGLHNVFTSQVDFTQTAQRFQDYTLREKEIANILKASGPDNEQKLPKLPKRLRGLAEKLTQRLQILHRRCSYWELLRHYCPAFPDAAPPTREFRPSRSRRLSHQQPITNTAAASQSCTSSRPKRLRKLRARGRGPPVAEHSSVTDIATPPSKISAFCRAALLKIVPREFWGDGDTGKHNVRVFSRKVDHFIKLRRFETMSLHEICQDMKVSQTQAQHISVGY